jgi:hypothetical protein
MRNVEKVNHNDGSVTIKKEFHTHDTKAVSKVAKEYRDTMSRSGYDYQPNKNDITFFGFDKIKLRLKFIPRKKEL